MLVGIVFCSVCLFSPSFCPSASCQKISLNICWDFCIHNWAHFLRLNDNHIVNTPIHHSDTWKHNLKSWRKVSQQANNRWPCCLWLCKDSKYLHTHNAFIERGKQQAILSWPRWEMKREMIEANPAGMWTGSANLFGNLPRASLPGRHCSFPSRCLQLCPHIQLCACGMSDAPWHY